VRLLLDTHTFLWLLNAPERLSEPARVACDKESNTLLLSTATVWELQIKHQRGRLTLEVPLEQILREQASLYTLVPIDAPHILQLYALALHHNDPFDRILVAQAIVEQATLVTADSDIQRYGELVNLLW